MAVRFSGLIGSGSRFGRTFGCVAFHLHPLPCPSGGSDESAGGAAEGAVLSREWQSDILV